MTGPVIGIDLGTTNTVVAAVQEGQATTLGDEDGVNLLPSVVSFHPSGNVLVGRQGKARRLVDAANTVYSVKRLIGRSWDSEEVRKARARFPFEMREGPGQAALVVARGETYTLPEISAFVLRKAKTVAEEALGLPVERAVITVPANFNDLQRAATKVAGRVSGLEVLRILNEPTAAALAYGFGKGSTERIAIYDFGGGTFDVTLLDLSGNVFEVLATAGNTFLGGDDVDIAIAEKMAEVFLENHRYDAKTDPQAFERLRAAAEQVKIGLSTDEKVTVPIPEVAHGSGGSVLSMTFSMTRAELERLVAPLISSTFDVCKEAMGIARLNPRDFDKVLLVGGSTRIPLVRKRVEEYFEKESLEHINPDEVVAIGAAIQASALTGSERKRGSVPAPPMPAARAQAQTLTRGQTMSGGKIRTQPPPLPRRKGVQTAPGVGARGRLATSPGGLTPPRARMSTSPGLHPDESAPTQAASALPGVVVPPPGGMPSTATPNTAPGPGASRRRQSTGMGIGKPPTPSGPEGKGLGARGKMATGPGLGPIDPGLANKPTLASAGAAAATGKTLMSAVSSTPAAKAPKHSLGTTAIDDGWGAPGTKPGLSAPTDSAAPKSRELNSTVPLTTPETLEPGWDDITKQSDRPPRDIGLPEGATEQDVQDKYGDLPLVMPGGAAMGAPVEASPEPKKRRAPAPTQALGSPPSPAIVDPEDNTAVGAPSQEIRQRAGLTPASAIDEEEDVLTQVTDSADLDSLPVPEAPSSPNAGQTVSLDPAPSSPAPSALGATAPLPSAARVETEPHSDPLGATVGTGLGAAAGLALGAAMAPPMASPAPAAGPPGLPPLTTNMPGGTAPPWQPPGGPGPLIHEMAGSPHPSAAGPTPAAPQGPGAPLLVDVTPLSLTVETVSGFCDNIIARNTPVPCEQTRQFVTATDNQTIVRVRVSQGESQRFSDNTLLGELQLDDLRPAARGEVEIAVTFALDTDGILNVSATDVQTGRAQQARVRLVGTAEGADVGDMAARHAAHPVV